MHCGRENNIPKFDVSRNSTSTEYLTHHHPFQTRHIALLGRNLKVSVDDAVEPLTPFSILCHEAPGDVLT